MLAGAILLLVSAFLLKESLPALAQVGLTRFFTDGAWHPAASPAQFNLMPMLLGTLYAMLGSVLIATPLGVMRRTANSEATYMLPAASMAIWAA